MLLHPELGKHYQVTDYAKGQFMRVRFNQGFNNATDELVFYLA
jgi:hypothetical protein